MHNDVVYVFSRSAQFDNYHYYFNSRNDAVSADVIIFGGAEWYVSLSYFPFIMWRNVSDGR